MCAAGALRGSPASTTITDRRWRPSCRAAASPATDPPTMATSQCRSTLRGAWSLMAPMVRMPSRPTSSMIAVKMRLGRAPSGWQTRVVSMDTPYEILNVPTDASTDEIGAAFRRLSVRVHPDQGGIQLPVPQRKGGLRHAVGPTAARRVRPVAEGAVGGAPGRPRCRPGLGGRGLPTWRWMDLAWASTGDHSLTHRSQRPTRPALARGTGGFTQAPARASSPLGRRLRSSRSTVVPRQPLPGPSPRSSFSSLPSPWPVPWCLSRLPCSSS